MTFGYQFGFDGQYPKGIELGPNEYNFKIGQVSTEFGFDKDAVEGNIRPIILADKEITSLITSDADTITLGLGETGIESLGAAGFSSVRVTFPNLTGSPSVIMTEEGVTYSYTGVIVGIRALLQPLLGLTTLVVLKPLIDDNALIDEFNNVLTDGTTSLVWQ